MRVRLMGFFDEESVSGVVCMRDDCLKTDREIEQVCAWGLDVEHCSASRFACRLLASITCEVQLVVWSVRGTAFLSCSIESRMADSILAQREVEGMQGELSGKSLRREQNVSRVSLKQVGKSYARNQFAHRMVEAR
jgi:hypothetical protein